MDSAAIPTTFKFHVKKTRVSVLFLTSGGKNSLRQGEKQSADFDVKQTQHQVSALMREEGQSSIFLLQIIPLGKPNDS